MYNLKSTSASGIYKGLVEEGEQYYARDLENVSLVDMLETIAHGF